MPCPDICKKSEEKPKPLHTVGALVFCAREHDFLYQAQTARRTQQHAQSVSRSIAKNIFSKEWSGRRESNPRL
jgi:hypothetical protein